MSTAILQGRGQRYYTAEEVDALFQNLKIQYDDTESKIILTYNNIPILNAYISLEALADALDEYWGLSETLRGD